MKVTCGLIGAHIGNSRFGAALSRVGSDYGVEVVFEPMDTAQIAGFVFEDAVHSLRDKGWDGVTVTHPFKMDAMALAERRINVPPRLLSANLLLFGDGISATNTDYLGFRSMWAEAGCQRPGRVAMAGAGGVAQSIATALDELGAEDIAVWDLRSGAAAALVDGVGGAVRAISVAEAPAVIRAAAGVVNATPLGMASHSGSAFPAPELGAQEWAFDAVYGPEPTEFAVAAGQAGLRCLTGHDLFRHMLLASFAAYSGIRPDTARILPVLKALTEAGS